MRFVIFIPGSFFILLIVFLIGVTRQPSPPEELYPTPRNVKEFLRRGELYKKQGNYEKALADYIQAAKFDPDSTDAYRGQALSLSALDRHAEAIEKFKIVKQIRQQNGEDHKLIDYLIQREEQDLQKSNQHNKP
jgi:tetratricopeptide (TPR) repeat protein